MVNKEAVVKWLSAVAAVYDENRAYLTELDSAIGDADHGINMTRGFHKIMEKMPELQEKGMGDFLKGVGMTLVTTVGGASGPLYGTFYMRMGMAADDKEELDAADLLAMFDAGLQGILQRGKAELGDKTMVDAMTPALEAYKAKLDAGEDLSACLKAAADAAEEGMKATIPLQARKGRASYLGERSIGHQDPGSTSTFMLFDQAYKVLGGEA